MSVIDISELFQCMICLNKLQDAHLCPYCSKMCCKSCAAGWIPANGSCPHCRKALSLDRLVNCRWADELNQRLADLKKSAPNDPEDGNRCPRSGRPLDIYAIEKKVSICHHCALFNDEYKGCTFRDLKDVYDEHVEAISSRLTELHGRKEELLRQTSEVEQNAVLITSNYEREKGHLEECIKAMERSVYNDLERQLKSKMDVVMKRQQNLSTQTKKLGQMLFRVDEELQSSPHSTLVKRSASLLETFDDILATNTDSVHPHEPVPPTFTSLLPAPVAVRGTVAVTIKAPLRPRVGSDDSGGDLPHVFSDPILFCGFSWRLKVYPEGIETGAQTHLSVFLELLDAPPRDAFSSQPEFSWRVDLIPQASPTNLGTAAESYFREATCVFETGECWGYASFYQLADLANDGYVGQGGKVHLQFEVRAANLLQLAEMQKWTIDTLKEQNAVLRQRATTAELELLLQEAADAPRGLAAPLQTQPQKITGEPPRSISPVGSRSFVVVDPSSDGQHNGDKSLRTPDGRQYVASRPVDVPAQSRKHDEPEPAIQHITWTNPDTQRSGAVTAPPLAHVTAQGSTFFSSPALGESAVTHSEAMHPRHPDTRRSPIPQRLLPAPSTQLGAILPTLDSRDSTMHLTRDLLSNSDIWSTLPYPARGTDPSSPPGSTAHPHAHDVPQPLASHPSAVVRPTPVPLSPERSPSSHVSVNPKSPFRPFD